MHASNERMRSTHARKGGAARKCSKQAQLLGEHERLHARREDTIVRKVKTEAPPCARRRAPDARMSRKQGQEKGTGRGMGRGKVHMRRR
eukprot:6190180-Pleurochrysis_carterae.AAC.2